MGRRKRPNALATYAALRADLPGAESATVKDFKLEREAGSSTSTRAPSISMRRWRDTRPARCSTARAIRADGEGCGRTAVAGAADQKRGYDAGLHHAGVAFYRGTAEEIRKASLGAAGDPDGHVRERRKTWPGLSQGLSDNIELRMLADVIGSGQGQYFLASFHMGNLLTGKNVVFLVDPKERRTSRRTRWS